MMIRTLGLIAFGPGTGATITKCWLDGRPVLPGPVPATVRRVAGLPLQDPYLGRVDVLQVTARVSCIVEPSVEIMVRDPHSVRHWIMVWGNARIQPEGAVI